MAHKHHIHGPSSLDALSKCIRFKYDDMDADAANEGTEMHNAAERENMDGLNEEQRTQVKAVLGYVESLKYEDGTTPSEWVDLKEARLELKELTHGTADRVLIHNGTQKIHVIDYKFTRVENDHQFQLRAYGAAVVEQLCDLAKNMYGETDTNYRAELHVVAPRLTEALRETHNGNMLLEAVRKEIEELYAKIENPFNQPTAHDDLCRKCARAGECPAMRSVAVSVAPHAGLHLPTSFDIESASPKDRAILQILASSLIQAAEKWKKSNTEAVKNGMEIPGFKLSHRSTGLRLPKESVLDFLERMHSRYQMTAEDLLSCANVTIGALYDRLATDTGRTIQEIKEEIRTNDTDILQEGFSSFLAKEKRIPDADLLAIVAGENN